MIRRNRRVSIAPLNLNATSSTQPSNDVSVSGSQLTPVIRTFADPDEHAFANFAFDSGKKNILKSFCNMLSYFLCRTSRFEATFTFCDVTSSRTTLATTLQVVRNRPTDTSGDITASSSQSRCVESGVRLERTHAPRR